MINNQPHIPVMLNEVLQNLQIKSGETYVDATFGAGGYSTAILQEADCKLIAFDRDKNVIKFVENLQNKFGNRFNFINEKFSEIENSLTKIGINEIDGLVMDIGVSSMQLDNEERGFSFDSSRSPLGGFTGFGPILGSFNPGDRPPFEFLSLSADRGQFGKY